MPAARPIFEELDRAEADELLRRHHVGRIAFAFRDRVDIEPVHYAYDGEWIYFRTGAGTKLATLARSPWAAFEVDEVEGIFRWRSVVVHGSVYHADPEGDELQREAFLRGVTLLRAIVPASFTPDDPVPERSMLLRLYANEVHGRRAREG